ncbi:MAG: hypothetical protein KKI02_06025 [Planctomycetes bacterium]|nr:hypothetical protein [Planctomycetota bacterium]
MLLDDLPVNSCLVPTFQVQGRAVRTIESIEPSVVNELNKTGTSQCGACSPGIVMSMRWLQEHPEVASEIDLRSLMSGNLCRCTGYAGIIAGVRQVLGQSGQE